jgi:hypothetical protein
MEPARAHRELALLRAEREREKLKTKPAPCPNTALEQEQGTLENTGTSNTLREPKPKDTPANRLDTRVPPTHNTARCKDHRTMAQ